MFVYDFNEDVTECGIDNEKPYRKETKQYELRKYYQASRNSLYGA